MRLPLRSLFLAPLILVACAAPAQAVIGGTPTAPGHGRFMVALIDAATGDRTVAAGQFCAATAVRSDVLVTAAHCLLDESGSLTDPADIRVFAGQVLPLRKGKLAAVRATSVYPGYDDGAGQSNGDFGIVRLARPLPGVTPIPVETAADEGLAQPGAQLGLFGWGNRAKGDGQNYPRQLQDGLVTRFTDQRCDDLYGRYFNPASQLCAGTPDGNVDACQGDSGGPLVTNRPDGQAVLVGVVSFGEGCGRPDFPTVYTKLSRFRGYLAKATARG